MFKGDEASMQGAQGDWEIDHGAKVSSVQFSSVIQSCLTLCNPMNRSMPGLPVHHQVPKSTQTHVHVHVH